MSTPKERSRIARPNKQGRPSFDWQLTDTSQSDTVKLIVPPMNSLPVVFVPGIMGSNLKNKENKAVWRLDISRLKLGRRSEFAFDLPGHLVKTWIGERPGLRQSVLHPQRVTVDREGAVPRRSVGGIHSTKEFRARGWGEVGETSYHEFLIWLERTLNEDNGLAQFAQTWNFSEEREAKLFGAEQLPFDVITHAEIKKRAGWRFPVYAVGYNWLDSNEIAANRLKQRIAEIIAENDRGHFSCEQVILVTHSMGGLVARACSELKGMREKIAGIVHGVMPSTGASVAYRRCKVGMWDEDWKAALVIGITGPEVTAVFAQAPGALQLLPTQDYGANWLKICGPDGAVIESWPKPSAGGTADPYTDIYLRKDRWWGLVQPEWLSPRDGRSILWGDFKKNVIKSKEFHAELSKQYHPNTYVFYGADAKQPSFKSVAWNMKRGMLYQPTTSPKPLEVANYGHTKLRQSGSNPIHVGGKTETVIAFGAPVGAMATVETSHWEVQCAKQDVSGDGTVPEHSGKAPLTAGKVKQQFRLAGFGHEPAFRDRRAQEVTLYAITKICITAKVPA